MKLGRSVARGCERTCESQHVVVISFPLLFQLSPDPDSEFCWTEAEIADVHDNTAFVIAADGSAFCNYAINLLP